MILFLQGTQAFANEFKIGNSTPLINYFKSSFKLIPNKSLVGNKLFLDSSSAFGGPTEKTPPNIILIFCDDLGYGDLSGYGSVWNQTPEIDKMMTEGLRFTDFYAGAPVCTASRAALMTGSYPRRVDLDLDDQNKWVLFPKASKGINPIEKILPEILKEAGYATAIIGKWHLGDQPEFLPLNHGFDFWYGLPYSNDMGINVNDELLLPLMRNEEVVESIKGGAKNREHQATLTQKYTEASLKWIDEHKKRPFFLYLSHTMPHVPVAAREAFHQQTNHPNTAFGESIAEISWSTGQVLENLKEMQLSENTLVIFTSDNGGAQKFGSSNGILKGSKGQTYEGGIRVPFVAWWPGKIEPGKTCLLIAVKNGPSGQFNTGIFGTKYILETLSAHASPDAVFNVVNSSEFPGWGFMIDNGATTIWETWKESDNTFTNCHPMLGTVTEWFYRWLGGIRPDPNHPGFSEFILAPDNPAGLDQISCRYDAPQGTIVSNWQRKPDNSIVFEIEIPHESKANVTLPLRPHQKISFERNDNSGQVGEIEGLITGKFFLEEGSYLITISGGS